MMGGMNNMMKQAQKLQKEMLKMQEELANKEYEVSAGADMVSVKINGKCEIQKIKISKDIVDPKDIEMLEDLVQSAVNMAIRKVNEASQSSLSSITGGMKIPGLNM